MCVGDNLRTSSLSFHYVDPNQIQVIRPRDKLPYRLSHLARLLESFLTLVWFSH